MKIPAYKDRASTYAKLWKTCEVDRVTEVDLAVEMIRSSKVQYEKIERITTVPAHIVGIIHYLELESYNGWGYFPTKIYSPYLWSFTSHYQRGKYTSDGVFDPTAISRQAGAMSIVRRMLDLNYLAMAPMWV